jgi:hypothetical protein
MFLKSFRTICLFVAALIGLSACHSIESPRYYFPGNYPGDPTCSLSAPQLVLSNQALEATWRIVNNSVVLSEITNKYDQQSINFEDIVLFALELEDGTQLNNLDFDLEDQPAVINLAPTDSLPTAALRFEGKQIMARMVEKDGNIAIVWRAELREGSNYIRQNIEVETRKESVKISQVVFFDGNLPGAQLSGSVLGSPIHCKSFFFGLEHPIAHSKALVTRDIGNITQETIDVSDIIDAAGEYIISVEHRGGLPNYNIESVALLENGQPVSVDIHPLNGENGNSFYHLKVDAYLAENTYHIQPLVTNPAIATGTFHIHRTNEDLSLIHI